MHQSPCSECRIRCQVATNGALYGVAQVWQKAFCGKSVALRLVPNTMAMRHLDGDTQAQIFGPPMYDGLAGGRHAGAAHRGHELLVESVRPEGRWAYRFERWSRSSRGSNLARASE
jgi:hypothetical protein